MDLIEKRPKLRLGEFLTSGTLSTIQIRFIAPIVEHPGRNGVMNVGILYELPITDMHSQGLEGILPEHADKIVSLIQHVNTHADVAAQLSQIPHVLLQKQFGSKIQVFPT